MQPPGKNLQPQPLNEYPVAPRGLMAGLPITEGENFMKYIVSWTLPQATYDPAVSRFLKAGGTPPVGDSLPFFECSG